MDIPEIAIIPYKEHFLCIVTTPQRYVVLKMEHAAQEKIKAYLEKFFDQEVVNKVIPLLPDHKLSQDVVSLSRQLPGIDQQAINPITKDKCSLWNIVIWLNDQAGWSRAAIADWIETLDVVPTFEVKENAFTVMADETRFPPGTFD